MTNWRVRNAVAEDIPDVLRMIKVYGMHEVADVRADVTGSKPALI